MTNPWCELGPVVTIHKWLMDRFSDMTGLEKRSLASKYLHFHRPEMFFIYDSRAKTAISKVTPPIKEIREIQCEDEDREYLTFVRRCQHLKDDIAQRFGKTLTPRQVDKILLNIAYKTRKSSELKPEVNNSYDSTERRPEEAPDEGSPAIGQESQ